MKKKLSAMLPILAFLLLVSFALSGSAVVAPSPDNSEKARQRETLEVVLQVDCASADAIKSGACTSEAALAYLGDSSKGEMLYGPADYRLIGDDQLCVLDTQAKRIRVYGISTKQLSYSVDISGCDRPQSVAVIGDVFYVYDVGLRKVFAYSPDGTLLNAIDTPVAVMSEDECMLMDYIAYDCALFAAELYVKNDTLYLMCAKDGKYVFDDYRLAGNSFSPCKPLYSFLTDDSMQTTVRTEGFVWRFDSYGVVMDIVSHDAMGNLYLYCVANTYDSDGRPQGGVEMRVYDKDSNLISSVEIDFTSFSYTTPRSVRCDANGKLYLFAGDYEKLLLMSIAMPSSSQQTLSDSTLQVLCMSKSC